MKKRILSLASILAISSLYAGTDGVTTKLKHGHDAKTTQKDYKSVDNLSDMFSHGSTSGQVRMFYVDRQYNGSLVPDAKAGHRNAFNLGGHLKFETAELSGLSLATAFYTTNNINASNYENIDSKQHDPSLTGTDGDSYSILGEAYVNYKFADTKTNAKLGYQKYDTPMMGSDDARMLPNTFQAYKLVSKDVENLKIQVAHVNQIAYGSFSNIYGGGILGMTSGYPGAGNAGTGKYHNLGKVTVGENTAGVSNAQVKYVGKNFHLKVSNDYAWDLYNTLYADAGASWTCLLSDNVHPFLQAQMIKQNSAGSKLLKNNSGNGEVDSLYWAAKFGVKAVGATVYAAYSKTGENTANDIATGNAYKNAIVSQFGGMPAYTQGMVTRHQFLAGTSAMKFAGAYNFKNLGTNLSAAAYYVSYDMDANSGYGIERTASESGFDIKYYPASVKKLQLRFRGNFPRKFAENETGDKGWNEYRLIANYTF